MPIYEYQCSNCGATIEALQKMSDAPKVDCPKCQTPSLKKLVSAASFRLKGGGWYETDFKTGNKKQLAETDSGSKPAASANSGSDKAAKPETGKGKTKSTTTKSSSS
ncbi:MAG: FmdB family zinc ribbon protein [Pseudohongiellaceae bacterium]